MSSASARRRKKQGEIERESLEAAHAAERTQENLEREHRAKLLALLKDSRGRMSRDASYFVRMRTRAMCVRLEAARTISRSAFDCDSSEPMLRPAPHTLRRK